MCPQDTDASMFHFVNDLDENSKNIILMVSEVCQTQTENSNFLQNQGL